jgi:hypothetical protein
MLKKLKDLEGSGALSGGGPKEKETVFFPRTEKVEPTPPEREHERHTTVGAFWIDDEGRIALSKSDISTLDKLKKKAELYDPKNLPPIRIENERDAEMIEELKDYVKKYKINEKEINALFYTPEDVKGGAKKVNLKLRTAKAKTILPLGDVFPVGGGNPWVEHDALAEALKDPEKFYEVLPSFKWSKDGKTKTHIHFGHPDKNPVNRLRWKLFSMYKHNSMRYISGSMKWVGKEDLANWWFEKVNTLSEKVLKRYIMEYFILLGYTGIRDEWNPVGSGVILWWDVKRPPTDERKIEDMPLQFLDPRHTPEEKLKRGKAVILRLRKGETLEDILKDFEGPQSKTERKPKPEDDDDGPEFEADEPKRSAHRPRGTPEGADPKIRERIKAPTSVITEPRGYSFRGEEAKKKGLKAFDLWDAVKEAKEYPEEFYSGDPLKKLKEIDDYNRKAFNVDVRAVVNAMKEIGVHDVAKWWENKATEVENKTRKKYIEEFLLLHGYDGVPEGLNISTGRVGVVPPLKKYTPPPKGESSPHKKFDPRNPEDVKIKLGIIEINKRRKRRESDSKRQAANRKRCAACIEEMKGLL